MYVIWDGQIWASYRPDDGWRPYRGPDAHVDHVHISMSWDGAMGRTSLWQAILPGAMIAMPSLGESLGQPGPATLRESAATVSNEPHLTERRREREASSEPSGETQQQAAQDETDSTAALTDTVTTTTDDTVTTTSDTLSDTTDDVEDELDDVIDDVTGAIEESVSGLTE